MMKTIGEVMGCAAVAVSWASLAATLFTASFWFGLLVVSAVITFVLRELAPRRA